MADAGHEALVLTAAGAVRYATGVALPHGDASAEAARPFVAVVRADRIALFGVDGAAPLPRDATRAAGALADVVGDARRVGVDRLPFALGAALARALPHAELVGADASVLAARAVKAADELALLRAAQALNEAAIADVLPAIVPGVREIELTGRFLAAMARRGVTACHVEPIWCVVPRSASDAPWTFPGGPPYRELTSERVLAAGDQVMIDTGMLHGGYMSDFGCTWTCGTAPDAGLRARWEAIVDAVLAECRPGRSGAALHAAALAANGSGRPAPWPCAALPRARHRHRRRRATFHRHRPRAGCRGTDGPRARNGARRRAVRLGGRRRRVPRRGDGRDHGRRLRAAVGAAAVAAPLLRRSGSARAGGATERAGLGRKRRGGARDVVQDVLGGRGRRGLSVHGEHARDVDAERRSLAEPARHRDGAAERLHELLHDAQAEAMPPVRRVLLSPIWWNASKIAFTSASAMPVPVSVTSMRTHAARGIVALTAITPSSVNFTALSTRLRTISWSFRPVGFELRDAAVDGRP
jgi:hypothetical protein